MDNGFEAGGREFKLGKIDAFKQFHIVRRLGPILGDIIPVAQKIRASLDKPNQSEDDKLEVIAQLSQPIMQGLSKLSDEDADKVLLGLLSSVEVKQMPAGNWARVSNDKMIMMQDLELPLLLQAAGRAFAFNLSGFFSTARQTSQGVA